ncbi:MAG: hypothetical protein ACTSWE_03770 [Promethearchaeota archaeon]
MIDNPIDLILVIVVILSNCLITAIFITAKKENQKCMKIFVTSWSSSIQITFVFHVLVPKPTFLSR